MRLRWKIGWSFVGPTLRFLFGVHVHGREHVPRKGALIIASNHMSFVDPPLVGHAVARECWYPAKEELFGQSRFFRWLIAYFNAIPIKREKTFDTTLFRKVRELLKKGKPVIIFPEGTRSRSGKLLPFKSGVGMLAMRYNAPVLPMYIKNTCRPWQEWVSRKSRPEAFIGPVLYPEGSSKDKDVYEKFTRDIERAVHRLANEAYGRVSEQVEKGSRRAHRKRSAAYSLHKSINPQNKVLSHEGKVSDLVKPGKPFDQEELLE